MAPSETAPGPVPGRHPVASSEPGGPSPSLLQDSSYTKTSQELIQFVTTLRALGAQVFLDLPRIVVIGNQSAGKSSLVEAISGISVPRDAGTCTRCPMECRLAHSRDAWSCQISIRWEYDDAGEHLDEVQEVPFGPGLTDKSEVEPMLRRAQGAILNAASATALTQYVDNPIEYGGKGRKALAFSRNTICVDLAGPELVDLSFVDLPGIVQNAEADVVRLVEDLVTSYVGGNCLILVALPMSGVLTKPDTIPAGSTKRRQMWLDVIEGRNEEHALQQGYFCTRQPDDDQRLARISPSEARVAETAFFRITEPWSASVCPHRYGTQNLVKSISELLTRIISDSLPQLIEEVTAQLAATNKQLDTLPPLVTTEPSAFVLDIVTRFQNDVVELTEGSPRRTVLVQKNRETYEKFKLAIRGTAPAFVPYEKAKKGEKYKRSRARYARMDEDEPDEEGRMIPPKKYVYLQDVREHIRAAVTRELPNNIPYPAKKSLIREYQETWEAHALACFHRVQDDFKRSLGDLIKQRFERFHHLKGVIGPTVMEQVDLCSDKALHYVKKILTYESSAPFTQNTQDLMDKRHNQLGKYKHARSGMPSTTQTTRGVEDEDEDEDEDDCWIARLASGGPGKGGSGFAVPAKTLSDKEKDTLKSALAELVKLGFPVTEEDLGKLHPPDEYEEELEVMAEVRAYFQVSYKRVIDYVPLAIDEDLLYALAGKLQSVLIEKLGLGSAKADARCVVYIAEDPHVVSLRAELMAKKKLEAVQRALFNFGL
ncbi:P-loop containing nucleoside triphosphate hydrolase protein [Trametes meyenii]|nr:P-loop containing nucleoside triphosphate hydrolase protein [Trametes meyenii]